MGATQKAPPQLHAALAWPRAATRPVPAHLVPPWARRTCPTAKISRQRDRLHAPTRGAHMAPAPRPRVAGAGRRARRVSSGHAPDAARVGAARSSHLRELAEAVTAATAARRPPRRWRARHLVAARRRRCDLRQRGKNGAGRVVSDEGKRPGKHVSCQRIKSSQIKSS